jgi:hypothetical protein
MMPSSRTGVRSRPGTVREGRPLPTNADPRTRKAPPKRKAQQRPVPISVPPSPSEPSARTGSSRAPFIMLVLALAIGGLVGLVLLNTAVNENAFRLHALATNQATLDKQESQLRQELDDREAPARLAAEAAKMGLVPAGRPAFVVLPDGKVVGTPEPAQAPSSPAASTPAASTSSKASGTTAAGQPTPSATPDAH